MHCKIEDMNEKSQIKYPALYKSGDGNIVFAYDINSGGMVYYLLLNGEEPVKVQTLMDYHFVNDFTYFHGIVHLSN